MRYLRHLRDHILMGQSVVCMKMELNAMLAHDLA